jgi:hypothetical protein
MIFDPTAFDNLKVVIEGKIYDLDLQGEIVVVDRSDIIDLASMSRKYKISFMKQKGAKDPLAYIQLSTTIEHLASEITGKMDVRPGAIVEVGFFVYIHHAQKDCLKIEKLLKNIWGEHRDIRQKISFEWARPELLTNEITISFHRFIYEENVDDLLNMIDYSIQSVEKLTEWKCVE